MTIRDQTQADAARATAMLESSAQQAITSQIVQKFAETARERIRIDGGGYRRRKAGYARRLQFCSEVADGEGFEPPVGLHPRRFSRPVL